MLAWLILLALSIRGLLEDLLGLRFLHIFKLPVPGRLRLVVIVYGLAQLVTLLNILITPMSLSQQGL